MNFLGAVAGFLSTIWLAYFIFVTMDNTMLGIASMGAIGIAFILTFKAIQEDK